VTPVNEDNTATKKKEVSQMHCPHLLHDTDRCEAVKPRFSPSEFELDEYCATEQHLRCPVFRNHPVEAVGRFPQPGRVPEAKLFQIK
jgi:hypothetical protein